MAKIEQIDDKLRQLTAMRAALAQLVTACECDRAAMQCPIIEALEHAS